MTRGLFAGSPDWRAPSGKEMACEVCKAAAPCGIGQQHYCVQHAPSSFWPDKRAAVPPETEDVV